MNEAPWTGLGRAQQDIEDLKQRIEGRAPTYETVEIKRRLVKLEQDVDRVESALENLQNDVRDLLEFKNQVEFSRSRE